MILNLISLKLTPKLKLFTYLSDFLMKFFVCYTDVVHVEVVFNGTTHLKKNETLKEGKIICRKLNYYLSSHRAKFCWKRSQ